LSNCKNIYEEYLPKVDADIINDLLTRQRENPLVTPIYMSEVFIKEGINSQKTLVTQDAALLIVAAVRQQVKFALLHST
jgi:hypothetical protein